MPDTELFPIAFLSLARSAAGPCRLRLAPTPSGFLHAGNALNFIFNYLIARCQGGRLVLRIDDLDAERKRDIYVQDIFETLDWLGLDYDEGPGLGARSSGGEHWSVQTVSDFEQNWSQFRRLPLYIKMLNDLREKGLLYACGKSRREISAFQGVYPIAFRDQGRSLDEPDVNWRIRTPDGFPLPDFVVRRRDGIPSYQIASLADDLHFGITHIIRGADLAPSTAAQRFLAQCLDLKDFAKIQFLHHPLLMDETGEKLSKSAGSGSLRAIRDRGGKPQMLFAMAARMLGLPEKGYGNLGDLLETVLK